MSQTMTIRVSKGVIPIPEPWVREFNEQDVSLTRAADILIITPKRAVPQDMEENGITQINAQSESFAFLDAEPDLYSIANARAGT